MLRTTNTGAVVDQASFYGALGHAAAQTNDINALVERAAAGNYAGVNLDYQGAAANQSAVFTSFVANLAEALHGRGLDLAVTLSVPQRVNNKLGYSWSGLGSY